ncbi:MAG: hypothetical protein BGO38_13360 [Cellulomonas sp. 73-145]|uniref:lipopolysaccharide biosynthesis protein n=1 Tax=unclassified Cellulomonas TaxID=2620175 RepID=UPI00092CA249|nr:hypothetical protein [Cellulomonas sp. 73-145]OJV59759.1 MAG: hypothetical protein BGO38_13360 [Cellulomonas sp. 73-145]
MNERRAMRLGYLRRHAAPLATVGAVSVVGILASTLFQALTGRGLGPAAFGLLAAFLSIVNIAAIGASALQNSVAVATARTLSGAPDAPAAPRRWDGAMVEGVALGGGGALVVAALAGPLSGRLGTSVMAVLLAAATVLPSFLFSVAQGRLQGAGRATAVAGWSTASQVLRLVLAGVALLAGLGAVSILVAVLLAIGAAALAAAIQADRAGLRTSTSAFTRNSVVLIGLTLAFAWLTNIDVMLVRTGAPEHPAGMFAAAAVLAKLILIVPTTLSLYLLPRFVNRREDHGAMRFGVNVVLLTVLGTGLLGAGALAILGGFVIRLFFGSGYADAVGLLPALALAYVPWALSQGLLIRLTASRSRRALVVLLAASVAQWVLARQVLPDLRAMTLVIGVLGAIVAGVFYLLHHFSRAQSPAAPTAPESLA